jgi:glutaconate CoA-transferase subunit B
MFDGRTNDAEDALGRHSLGEFLTIQLARDLADGEKAIVGTNSDIQVGACNLARRMHAPNLWWVSGPGGMVNADDPVIRPTADFENIANSEAVLDLPVMIDFIDWKIHFFDFAILGALQIDKFGNINTVCVGPHERPRLRGPGTVGISALCGLSKRFYVMMSRHERGSFVEKVDFISGAGHLDGGNSRTERGLPSGGPKLVVTPLGIFDFEPLEKRMQIKSLHAGVTLEEVRDRTGFDLTCEASPPITVEPTDRELATLREAVDTTGVLQAKFPWPSDRRTPVPSRD